MKEYTGFWVLLGLLATVCAFGQTPARKRPAARVQPPRQTASSPKAMTAIQPIKPTELIGQILDSLRTRSNLRTVSIPLADLSVDPTTAMLTVDSQAYLDSVAVALNRLPTLLFDVVGYAVTPGDTVKNRLDAENRASVVWDYFVLKGQIAAYRTQYRGYSSLRPLVSKNTRLSSVRNPPVRLALTGLDTSRVVVLHLTNTTTTTVEAAFAYKDDAAGMFFYKTATDAPLLLLPVSQVSQTTNKSREILSATVASTTQADGQPTDSKSTETASGTARSAYRYTTFTIGAEGLYVLPALSPQWADDAIGLGLRQGVGGSLMLTRRFGRWAGASMQAGYGQWETWRLYTLAEETQYEERAKLQQILAQIGLKIYVLNNLYLMPTGGAWGMRLTVSTNKEQPIPPLPNHQDKTFWGYGGQVGYELNAGHTVVEFSATYNIIKKSQSPPFLWYYWLDKPLQYLSIRIGFGFRSKR